jgi:hypothetical protein
LPGEEDVPLTPPSNNSVIYGGVGVLLLLATFGLVYVFVLSGDGGEADAGPPDAGVEETVERSTALADDALLIPEEEPDAGPPDAGVQEEEEEERTASRPPRGGANCTGDIDRAGASRILAENRFQFRSCYERALRDNELLEGTMNVRMQVGRDGTVNRVTTSGSLRDATVRQCMIRTARRLRFPAVSGGSCALLEAPFNFTPQR